MRHLGNITEDSIIDFTFTSINTSGAPTQLAGTPAVSVYKANGVAQSTAGVTLTVDFDGVTGLNHVRIDTSADAFYAITNDYSVVITTGTVGGTSVVGYTLANFSIENRFNEVDVTKWLGTACATPTVAGVPEVDLTHIGGDAQSQIDLKDFADAGYDPATNKVQGVVLVDTTTTNTDMRGTDNGALASVCTEARLAELDAANLPATTDATLVDTAVIGAAGAGLTAVPWNAAWDAEVQSECTDALNAYDPPTNTEMVAAFTEIKGATWSSATDTLEAIRDRGDSAWITATGFATSAALATAQTDLDTITGADGVTLATAQGNYAPLRGGVAMTEAYAADGATATPEQMFYMIWASLSEFAISGMTITAKKLDGATTAMTFTLDDGTNPTSRTRAT